MKLDLLLLPYSSEYKYISLNALRGLLLVNTTTMDIASAVTDLVVVFINTLVLLIC